MSNYLVWEEQPKEPYLPDWAWADEFEAESHCHAAELYSERGQEDMYFRDGNVICYVKNIETEELMVVEVACRFTATFSGKIRTGKTQKLRKAQAA